MTAKELREYFSKEYGLEKPWPDSWEVDAETYANCCQEVFNALAPARESMKFKWGRLYYLSLGRKKGLMFKGVELVLKK